MASFRDCFSPTLDCEGLCTWLKLNNLSDEICQTLKRMPCIYACYNDIATVARNFAGIARYTILKKFCRLGSNYH